ncbi:MAG: glycosyltransferase family 9 protein [Nocardioidaceae bacterium]|nr:glycosyltransferase family 9 protein [Nocardioidaceae bacterium]
MSNPPVAFVLRALGLGDLLAGVPALRAVRRAFPHHELVLGCPPDLGPLVVLADVVDRVLPVEGLERIQWRGPPPDVTVNLHGKGPQSHEELLRIGPGPRRFVGYAQPRLGVFGPAWRADEHEVARWCRLITESLAVPADPGELALPLPAVEPLMRRAVIIHPGAAYASRRWPPERFAAVAAWAAAQSLPVAVTGSASERGLASEVASTAGLPDSAVLAGRTSLLELAALVGDARLLVSGDTGAAHLATAFGTPSVVLFGPTPPTQWGPPKRPEHVALWHGSGVGDPWGTGVDPALLRIGVDEVVSSAETMLAATRTTRSSS